MSDQVFQGLLVLIWFVIARKLADDFAGWVEDQRARVSAHFIFCRYGTSIWVFGIDLYANKFAVQISHHLRVGKCVAIKALAPSAPIGEDVGQDIFLSLGLSEPGIEIGSPGHFIGCFCGRSDNK